MVKTMIVLLVFCICEYLTNHLDAIVNSAIISLNI